MQVMSRIIFSLIFFFLRTQIAVWCASHPDEVSQTKSVSGSRQLSAVITVFYEEWDSIASSFINNLNASLLYSRDYLGMSDDAITLEQFMLPDNFTGRQLDVVRNKTNFFISLARTKSVKQAFREFAHASAIPTIQLRLSPWRGQFPNKSVASQTFDNYVQLVPSFVVFDNILSELVLSVNISGELLVLYDPHFDENVMYDWRKSFSHLPMPARFEPMFSDLSVASMHIKQLEVGAKNIFVVASTELVEMYLQAAIPQFEARHFRHFVVFSKDTLALKCEDCLSASLFWVRMMPDGRVETLRRFNDFLRQEELDVDMSYQVPVPTYAETQVSFCIDVISLALDYLLLTDQSLSALSKRQPKQLPDASGTAEGNNGSRRPQVTLKRLLQRDQQFEFGKYALNFGETYYQDMTGMILKVDRRVDEPEVDHQKYIANWTLERGITPFYDSLRVDVRKLNHYRIVTIIQEPFVQFAAELADSSGERVRPCASTEQVRLNTGQLVEGYCIDLLKMLKQATNFTYELYLVEDGKFGSVDENGNWDGMIGDLVQGKAEMALGPISVLAERENDIDFTVPFYDLVGLSILMKRSDVEYSMFKFLKVLEWPVWTCILAAYLFTSVLLWLFDRLSPYSYRNNRDKYVSETEKREFTLKECLWFCMTSLTPQGGGEAPKNVSGRLVAATWWLFGFIIIASYTANLAAFLTVSRMEQTISGLDDLAKQYKIEYAPLKGGATETYFRRMAEIEEQFYAIWKQMSLNESMESRDRAKLAVWDYPVQDKFTNMWRFMQESKLPRNITEAVNRVLESEKGFAFIGDAMEIKYAIFTNCRLQQVGSEFSRKPYAIAVQTNHELKEPLSQAILKLQNERKLETCKERWWHQNERRKDCPNSEDDSGGISIQNIGGVFLVILAGIGISMVMLLCEYVYYTKKAKEEEARQDDRNIDQRTTARESECGSRKASDRVPKAGWNNNGKMAMPGAELVQHRYAHTNPAFSVD